MRYKVTADAFVQLPVTTGTVQNISNTDIEISNEEVVGSGIILKAGETFAFDSATVYVCARPVLDGGVGLISVVPFNGKGEGGGSYVLPIATTSTLGGVMSSTTEGKVSVGNDGVMSYNKPNSNADAWTSGKAYKMNDTVEDSEKVYLCIAAHTSGSMFADDLTANKWVCIGPATMYELPIANDTLLGGVKSSTVVGGVGVDTDGFMTFNLGVANDTLLGGVKSSTIEGGVGVDSDGNMSVKTPVLTATALLNWQPSTAYAVGDVVYTNALAVTQKLVCVQAGTSGTALTISSTTEGTLITDGTIVWQVDSFADGNYTAEHGNGIYRGVDITAYADSGLLSANIANGIFVGVHIGDYITKTINLPAITYTDKAGTEQAQAAQTFANAKFYIAGINSHLKAGDGNDYTTANHVVLIPANVLQRNVGMNPTNDTTGGYLGSDMWRIHMPNWSAAIKAAFGESHVVKYRDWMSNAIDATAPSGAGHGWVGAQSGWRWADVEVNIPNEQMIYGGRTFGSGHDCGSFPAQLPLFAHTQYIGGDDRSWYWLRAVASASHFAVANGNGGVDAYGASSVYVSGGIRPVFLYK